MPGSMNVPEGEAAQLPQIVVEGLRKVYRVPVRGAGLAESLRSLFRREYRDVEAVGGIDFSVESGEVVGFLGPNGAGKTTTLKILSGLLHPTEGRAEVLGFKPWRREADFLRQMTLVMGQKHQLVWDLPPMDTYLMNQAIYGLSAAEFNKTLDELIDLLDLADLLKKPVRNLSLGERMKCELVAALLHRPSVLFLDEPTIGLDVTMQRRIRSFLREYTRRHGSTVLLTSHYMADIEALCRRVIVIHHGRLLFDGDLKGLAAQIAPYKIFRIALADGLRQPIDDRFGEVLEQNEASLVVRVAKGQAPQATARMLAELPVADLTVEEPPITDVIEQVFQMGAESPVEAVRG